MSMTLDPAVLDELRQADPHIFDMVAEARASGHAMNHVICLPETDEVYISEGPGEPYEKAHMFVREMFTDIPARDVGEVDPVFPARAARDPILRVSHEAKVKDVVLYLADFYRPDLARKTPNLSLLAEAMVTVILRSQDKLAALPTVYERWDMITENMIEWMIEPPRLVPIDPRP